MTNTSEKYERTQQGNLLVPAGTNEYQRVPVSTSGFPLVPVGTNAVGTSGYQEYQEDQDQISGATYISDVVFGLWDPKRIFFQDKQRENAKLANKVSS